MFTTIDKALAGFAVALVLEWLARFGFTVSVDVQQALVVVVTAFLTGLTVWAVKNKKS